ncbi:hypothetical protein QR680_002115 [Steinernema hermaphroditum]|uniref:ETS domain-containing protein n=1 Tax=Steinernema hermaphroditum TaxID=289476 RepID=A0AA39H1B4_9BILA|nr:hypothetical protein QR680_002115 [Steinernema hermaphroditum]
MQRVTQYSPADSTTSTGYDSNNSDIGDHSSPQCGTLAAYGRQYPCYNQPPSHLSSMYASQPASSFHYGHTPRHPPRNYLSPSNSGVTLMNQHHPQFPYWNTHVPPPFPHTTYCSSYAENSYSNSVMSSSGSPQQSAQDSVMSECESEGGPIKLWQFLLELLQSNEVNCIEWTNNNPYEFRFTDRVEVARLWGKRKNKPKMNYEKLARSLRYYYGKDMIEKGQPGEKYVYHFTKNLMSKEFLSPTPSSH